MVRVNSFEGEKLNQIIELLDNPVKEMIMTAYDRLIEKGMEKGMEKGKIQKTIEAIQKMIEKNFDNQTIAEILDVTVDFVEKIRLDMK